MYKPKTIFSVSIAAGLMLLSAMPAIANPTSLVIDQEFRKAQKLKVSKDSDHFLDFSQSGYRVLKAYPSNTTQLRAISLSDGDNQQLVVRWLPGSTAKEATLVLKVEGPLGQKSLRYRVVKAGKTPDNILTMYTVQPHQEKVAIIPTYKGNQPRFDIAHSGDANEPGSSGQASSPIVLRPSASGSQPMPVQLKQTPTVLKIRTAPKVARRSRVSAAGRTLIERDSLSSPALANYLLRGLHRARSLRQINRSHRYYLQTQSAARVLRRGGSIPRALLISGLPGETFDNLLGHGGVSK